MDAVPAALAALRTENARLRERLDSAERYTAQTLARASRLSQVVAILAHDTDFDSVVGRAAVEVAELFSADIALVMLGPDDALRLEGECGVRPQDRPADAFAVTGLGHLTPAAPAVTGPDGDLPLPAFLAGYGARHLAWARLLVGTESLGLMLLVRRGPEPFERSDVTELRAIAYRIGLAMENGLLHRRMQHQVLRLSRIQEFTTQLTGMLELAEVGCHVADRLVSDVPVDASLVCVEVEGALVAVARCGCDEDLTAEAATAASGWLRLPLEAAGTPIGWVAVAGGPIPGSEAEELMRHLVGIAALALEKALLYERSREQARQDSLTGLLVHRAFQEEMEMRTTAPEPFSVVLLDIDDFKQVNDLYGHQTGDDALCLVADALRQVVRGRDRVFRKGGEEFCVTLPGLHAEAALGVAERLRTGVTGIAFPLPLTISLGIASYPEDGRRREDLLVRADEALYASKRAGKNCATAAGGRPPLEAGARSLDRRAHVRLLRSREPDTVVHSLHVASIAIDIARALGLDGPRLDDLRTAAQLHDVGKIAVPEVILGKPGPLDDDEYRIVQTHATVGAELLRGWGLDAPARFVAQHHEHADGSGYPAGLGGDEIALEARIIHVADAFVAMTLDRPYRKALTRAEATAELRRHAGGQFDPAVVEALLVVERLAEPALAAASG